jgi:probable extracellular repeat, HAF family
MIDLGPNSTRGINKQGQVIGEHAPGLSLGGSDWWGEAINESGQIAGSSYTADDELHALFYSNGVLTDLGALGGNMSEAYCINNFGQVVGEAWTASNYHAFLYQDGIMTDLGTLGGIYNSEASYINDSGQIVGFADAGIWGNPTNHAFLYSEGVMKDLGTLGGVDSFANGINNNGDVVGRSYLAGNAVSHAFLYSGGVMKDLGTLGGTSSAAWRINSKRQIVGYSYIAGNVATHAFLYTDGVMKDLNSLVSTNSGWTLAYAQGINDRGEIICDAENALFQTRGFLLRPTATLSILLATNHVTVSWPSNAFASFTLQTNTSLLTTNWGSVSMGVTLSNGVFRMTFPASGSSSFYRLKL